AVSGDGHPHVTALATVLGEASKLMAALGETGMGEEVEGPVARLLHDDCKAQALKVLEWFQHDMDLPRWQAQVVSGRPGAAGSASGSGSGSGGRLGPGSSNNWQGG
ncbi:unnamed protein product, partial [Discosporangium mesarthrocarpum]